MKSKINGRSRRRMYIALILLLMLAFTGFATPFRGLLNPGPPCTLADQIIAANDDKVSGGCPAGDGVDTIRLHDSVALSQALPVITSAIVIEGGGHTIDGDGKHQIFDVRGGLLHINDLTIIGGEATKGGAIMLIGGAELVFKRSAIKDSSAIIGGAIGSEHSKVSLIDSDFLDNSASGNGGAIHHTSSELSISGSSFVGNSGAYGGGVFSIRSDVRVVDSTFEENRAEAGGGIYVQDTDAHVSGASLENNRTDLNGGAIYSYRGSLTVSDSRIVENWVLDENGKGGAIGGHRASIRITESRISGNWGAGHGGGVHSGRGTLVINDSDLTANSAIYGGALSGRHAAIDVTDSTIDDNFGRVAGGGIYADGGRIGITNSNLRKNRSDYGGAVYTESAALVIHDGNMRWNRAEAEGGVIKAVDGVSTITSSFLLGNAARNYGGGFYLEGGALTLSKSAIRENTAQLYGGAIYSVDGAALDISNSTIMKNEAELTGGGIYANTGRLTLTHATLAYNLANHGGGLLLTDGTLNLRNSIIAGNQGGDCDGAPEENIHNLIEDGSCSPMLSGDPMLTTLPYIDKFYGLANGSPALDAARDEFCLPFDQWGFVPRPQGPACDLGAYELTPER